MPNARRLAIAQRLDVARLLARRVVSERYAVMAKDQHVHLVKLQAVAAYTQPKLIHP